MRIVEAGRPPRGLLEVLDEIAQGYRGRAREGSSRGVPQGEKMIVLGWIVSMPAGR
ncbi:hypothetical protein PABY_19730 [Pyrodictium abyssi]|uniref:Uncharacterized protein n=1 Tax=Pyrodictium abyssi TaxID=54256 RepID=A0ABM8IXY3_9CREN|nr:hypothetical protein PABY_19730 [Pyrodictium abyssi]